MFNPSFLDSMARLDEESRIEKEKKKTPNKLEDIIQKFCDADSECSHFLEESKLSLDFSISDTHEDSFNNKFKKNKVMPNFNDSHFNESTHGPKDTCQSQKKKKNTVIALK